jgi:putative spermidine/putrescine transport system ATP-binding protein
MREVPRPEIRKKVMAILELIQFEELGHRFPWHLSGGQQQRIALARARLPGAAA